MSLVDTQERYPFSTPGGDPIPFEIFRPYSLIRVNIADAVSGAVAIPATPDLLIMICDTPCIIRFGATPASVPADKAEVVSEIYLPSDVIWTIDHNGATTMTVIGTVAAATGRLYINTCKKWKDVQKPVINNRS